MGFLKRAFLYVTKKRGKSILLFIIFLVMATFVLTGLSIEKAAQIAKKAHRENSTLRETGINLGMYTGEEYDQWVNLLQMTGVEE